MEANMIWSTKHIYIYFFLIGNDAVVGAYTCPILTALVWIPRYSSFGYLILQTLTFFFNLPLQRFKHFYICRKCTYNNNNNIVIDVNTSFLQGVERGEIHHIWRLIWTRSVAWWEGNATGAHRWFLASRTHRATETDTQSDIGGRDKSSRLEMRRTDSSMCESAKSIGGIKMICSHLINHPATLCYLLVWLVNCSKHKHRGIQSINYAWNLCI